MTATRDRRSAPEAGADASIPWDERAVIASRRGLPWWGAVLLALGMALVGAVIDLRVSDALKVLFQGCYLVGSVAAVAAVRRRNLFGPMVQPPLILAITVPAIVLTGSGLPAGSDMLAKVLAISTPLINAFPMMAVTTILTVALGFYRTYRERDPNPSRRNRARRRRSEDDSRSVRGRREPSREGDEARGDSGRKARPRTAEGRDESSRRGEPDARNPGSPGSPGRPGRRPRPEAGPEPGDSAGRPPRRRPAASPDSPERRRRDDKPDAAGPKRPHRKPPREEKPPPGTSGAGRSRGVKPGGDERPRRRPRPRDDERG